MLSIEEGKDYDNVDDASLPYTLVSNLGHGHSGNVEEVRDEVTKTVFARKLICIPASRRGKQERTKVFHNEVKIIRALGRHRHIISVFATYVTKRHFGLILQPVASDGDLEKFLAEYWSIVRELEEPNIHNARLKAMVPVLEMAFGCLAAGLAFMHDKMVRHKDVKPRNILVHQGLVLYTDFGYSFDWNGFDRSTTEGQPGFLTRKYSAPEVLNHEKRNSRSDVYSLGCVFIDLLIALTLTQDPDNETSCYSENMTGIQERFKTLDISSRYSFLPEIINHMTDCISAERPRAADVAIETLTIPGFSCKDCTATPTEYCGIEHRQPDLFVRSIETLTLKQKKSTEGTFKGQRKASASEHPQFTPQNYNEPKETTSHRQETEKFKSNEPVKDKPNIGENEGFSEERELPSDPFRNSKELETDDHGRNLAPKEWGVANLWATLFGKSKGSKTSGDKRPPATQPIKREAPTISQTGELRQGGQKINTHTDVRYGTPMSMENWEAGIGYQSNTSPFPLQAPVRKTHFPPVSEVANLIWFCCDCGGGGNSCLVDAGCRHCQNHWFSTHCCRVIQID